MQCRDTWDGRTAGNVAYASALLGFQPDYLLSKVGPECAVLLIEKKGTGPLLGPDSGLLMGPCFVLFACSWPCGLTLRPGIMSPVACICV